MEEKNQYKEELKFIKNNFEIRNCYKYCGINDGLCKCNRPKVDHDYKDEGEHEWSYENNTRLQQCHSYGNIPFYACNDLCSNHRFIRFNVIDTTSEHNSSLPSIVAKAYTLTNVYWNIPEPKLMISVIGGFKKMDISNQQKKNFKQGLIDIMKKDKTMIIAGGFNVGVHKLVSETVRDFRIYYETEETRVHLIGICTWGVVLQNQLLTEENFSKDKAQQIIYQSKISNVQGKVALDHNYDGFLFCDDGMEKIYDKEVDFRSSFEKYVETTCQSFAVQILFEGGYRAVYMAHKTLENNISVVVLKGSGRAADLISDVIALKNKNLDKNIKELLHYYENKLNARKEDIPLLLTYLNDMYKTYSKLIVVYDMFDPKLKFGKMIVQALIKGQTKTSSEDILNLTMRFNVVDIAQTEVFSKPNYSKMDSNFINGCFLKVLKKNQFEFVISFLENDFDIANVLTKETLIELYRESFDIKNCPYADLLNDLISKKKVHELHCIGKIIPILSGNILKNYYSINKRKGIRLKMKDLFLWALFTGRIELAEIFWRYGKCHVSSALIGSTVLKNMADYILKRGDSELEKKLSDASINFEKLAFNILTKAYKESRAKTFTILIRSIKMWNKMTCLQIALNGNLLEFLSHSSCRSFTTKVWLGGLSPFLSLWKILLSIPFCFCSMQLLIIPSFSKKVVILRTKEVVTTQCIQGPEDCFPLKESSREENPITFSQATKMFYSAPIVKFYINFGFYLIFLVIFAYVNLVELKSREKIEKFTDVAAETYVYVYITTFIIEEMRQINDQSRNDFKNKCKAYFSGSFNKLDIFIIIIFFISTFFRFLLSEELFMICRCLYSVCYCMFCLRTMQFYFAYEFVGPKVIMIYNMMRDIVFFLSIFALFIVSYGILSQSMRSPNNEMDLNLLKNIFYMPYFQTYGELMLDDLFDKGLCNTTKCQLQQTTVIVGFAVYLLFTNILLVNLLIAMFGFTFNKIQEKSEKFWLFIRLQLVEEFYKKPILSPPFNVLYYIYMLIVFLISLWDCRKKKQASSDLKANMGKVKVKDVKNKANNTKTNTNEYSLLKVLPSVEYIRITGFEKICMEAMMECMQYNLESFVTKAETKTDENKNNSERIQLNLESTLYDDTQDVSNRFFQMNFDKRLEKIESYIETLIYKEAI